MTRQRAESVLTLSSFRAGRERRGALQEASKGWEPFRRAKAIDRKRYRLPLSVQGVIPSRRLGQLSYRLSHSVHLSSASRGWITTFSIATPRSLFYNSTACSTLWLAMFSSRIPAPPKATAMAAAPPGAQEQDPLAGEFDSGLPTGHDHPAPVSVVASEAGPIDHDGVHRPGEMPAPSSSSSRSEIIARLCGMVMLKPRGFRAAAPFTVAGRSSGRRRGRRSPDRRRRRRRCASNRVVPLNNRPYLCWVTPSDSTCQLFKETKFVSSRVGHYGSTGLRSGRVRSRWLMLRPAVESPGVAGVFWLGDLHASRTNRATPA